MGAVLCFVLFLAAVALCLLEGWSLIAAIWAGILFFGLLGLRKGFSIRPWPPPLGRRAAKCAA